MPRLRCKREVAISPRIGLENSLLHTLILPAPMCMCVGLSELRGRHVRQIAFDCIIFGNDCEHVFDANE